MQKTISMLLTEIGQQQGMWLYKNEETNLMYFKSFKFGPAFVTCPDGRSAFAKIEVHPHVIVCQLPWIQFPETPDEDHRKRFRIYLRKEKIWLVNPEIEKGIDGANPSVPAVEKEEKKVYNFFKVLQVHAEYVHLACQSNGVQDRIYVFKNQHWIRVPYFSLGVAYPITHFDMVIKRTFQNRECLLLKVRDALNPFSVYFLPSVHSQKDCACDGYFSIPNPPGFQEKYDKKECFIFRHVFTRYVVLALGGSLGVSVDSFYLWRLDTREYIPAGMEGDELSGVELKFKNEYFTEKYFLVKRRSQWVSWNYGEKEYRDYFTIISAETWKLSPAEFICKVTNANIVYPQIVSGKLVVSKLLPETTEKVTLE